MHRWLPLLLVPALAGCPAASIELEGIFTYVQLEPDDCTQPFDLVHVPQERPVGDLCDGCGVRMYVELTLADDGDCAAYSAPEGSWLAVDFDEALVYTSGDGGAWDLFGAGRVEGGPEGGRFLAAGPPTDLGSEVFTETWNVGWSGLPPHVP